MKNIIQRKLPLDTSYALVDKKYVSLVDGYGCTCDNCGKLIANMATIANPVNKHFTIGFDCLDTILLNNAILSQTEIADYQQYKQALTKIMKFIKQIKEVCTNHKSVTGINMQIPALPQYSDYYTFHWLHNGNTASRDNGNVKIKGITFGLLHKIISDYFKNLTIIVTNE